MRELVFGQDLRWNGWSGGFASPDSAVESISIFMQASWLRHAGTGDGGCCSGAGGAATARVELVGDLTEEIEHVLLICRPARHSTAAAP